MRVSSAHQSSSHHASPTNRDNSCTIFIYCKTRKTAMRDAQRSFALNMATLKWVESSACPCYPCVQICPYLALCVLCFRLPHLRLCWIGYAQPVRHSLAHKIFVYEVLKQVERGLREICRNAQHYSIYFRLSQGVVQFRAVQLVLGVWIQECSS